MRLTSIVVKYTIITIKIYNDYNNNNDNNKNIVNNKKYFFKPHLPCMSI